MRDALNTDEAWIGEVRIFAGNSVPRGWLFCDGRLLNISTYSQLFSVLGTTYGGDGVNTFAVPDLRGRVAVGRGQGPDTSIRALGDEGGSESTSLSIANLPQHDHTLRGTNSAPNQVAPQGNVLAQPAHATFHDPAAVLVSMGVNTGLTGGGAAFNLMPPFVTLNFIIAVRGRDPRLEDAILPET